jgi:ACR3 family arsenite transporter
MVFVWSNLTNGHPGFTLTQVALNDVIMVFAFAPIVALLLAIPIIIQVYFNSGLAYLLSRRLGVAHSVAAPAALIGASNFFELAVATAISLYGLDSGAALATVVGVLVEVPVILSVVRIVNATRPWYERAVHSAT